MGCCWRVAWALLGRCEDVARALLDRYLGATEALPERCWGVTRTLLRAQAYVDLLVVRIEDKPYNRTGPKQDKQAPGAAFKND